MGRHMGTAAALLTLGLCGALGLPANSSRRSLAFPENDLTLLVANPNLSIPPGIHLPCYGPFTPPAGALSLRKLLPKVNMGIVHHMIMFGGTGRYTSKPGSTHMCYQGSIMYAWARTGQTTPIGLDFGDAPGGAAYQVGAGGTGWVALQVHYQQLESPSPLDDKSGVRLSFAAAPPRRPLKVELMMSTSLRIPAGRFQDECVLCRVQQGGAVVAFRNHAHRLARGVWSDHWDANGRAQPPLGNLSAQPANRDKIFLAGGHDQVVAAMMRSPNSVAIQQEGAGSIRNMATAADACELLAAEELDLQAIAAGAEDLDVIESQVAESQQLADPKSQAAKIRNRNRTKWQVKPPVIEALSSTSVLQPEWKAVSPDWRPNTPENTTKAAITPVGAEYYRSHSAAQLFSRRRRGGAAALRPWRSAAFCCNGTITPALPRDSRVFCTACLHSSLTPRQPSSESSTRRGTSRGFRTCFCRGVRAC